MALWSGRFVGRYRRIAGTVAALAIATGLVVTQIRHVDIQVKAATQVEHFNVWTFHRTVAGALYQSEIALSPHDTVSPGMAASLAGLSSITVRRAIPVTVKTPQHDQTVWTDQTQVKALLANLHIQLGPLDQVKPGLDATLAPHSTVTIIRRWVQQKVSTKAVLFSVQYKPNPHAYEGTHTVIQQGKNGTEQITSQVTMQDGKALGPAKLISKLLAQPVPEIVAYGTVPLVARGSPPPNSPPTVYQRTVNVVATAYWPDPAWSNGYTATGIRAGYGVVAVDPRVIPLGAKLYIPGYGDAVAADTGGAIVGDRIDLCYNTAQQAQDFGVQRLTVYILSP